MGTAGERIKVRREELGWSMGKLSRESGVSMGHLSKLESGDRGERIGPDILTKLADALGVTPKWLGTGKGPKDVLPDRIVSKDDRYPNRQIAADFARRSGIPEEAIKPVLEMALDADEDPSPDWWLDQIKAQVTLLKGKSLPTMRVRSDEIPAPRGPRKRPDT